VLLTKWSLGIHPTQNTLHVIKLSLHFYKGGKRWQNIFQQKLTVTTEGCHAVLDSGVVHIVIARYYMDTRSVSN
jgi:microcystin degradation protein MlrC